MPARGREARATDDGPDPSAVIDWLIKGNAAGNP
jgi:hypothetical protein